MTFKCKFVLERLNRFEKIKRFNKLAVLHTKKASQSDKAIGLFKLNCRLENDLCGD